MKGKPGSTVSVKLTFTTASSTINSFLGFKFKNKVVLNVGAVTMWAPELGPVYGLKSRKQDENLQELLVGWVYSPSKNKGIVKMEQHPKGPPGTISF